MQVQEKKTAEAKNIDPDEADHNENPHLALHCLSSSTMIKQMV